MTDDSGNVTGDSGKLPKIGHDKTECAVTIIQNRRSRSNGMGGHDRAEYAKGANKDNALSHKHKELMALAIGISIRCDGCIAFHAKAVAELGATREEVMEMLGVCMYMGGGPAFTYAAQALEAFDSFANKS
nr:MULTISPECIES: carboxymuconolactone decarboxylase family protein [unclassified Halomonas]